MTTAMEAEEPSSKLDWGIWKIAGVVLLGPLMTSLDMTVVNVSMSTLGREMHASLSVIQWVTSGYLLSLALMLPLSGWMVDRIGAKRVYLWCFTLFTLASMLCGLANGVGTLIAARVLQGIAGGLLAPMAQMMVARIAGRHVARLMGYMVVPIMLGPILGPVVAGLIVQHASWRWIFFINLPVGVLATVLAWRVLPHDAHETQRRSFDALGFVLLSPALVLALHGLERMNSGSDVRGSVAEIAAAAALIGGFLWHALRLKERAILDVRLFTRKTFSASASTQFLSNAASIGSQMVIPLYLITVLRKTPSETGVLMMATGFGMLLTFPMMGAATERFGPKRVSTFGSVVALVGTLPFAFFGAQGMSVALLCGAMFVRGVGQGCINIPSIAAAYTGLPKAQIAVATAAINIVQRLGGPIATTSLAILLHRSLLVRAEGPAFAGIFWAVIGLHGCCTLAALRLPWTTVPREVKVQAAEAVAE